MGCSRILFLSRFRKKKKEEENWVCDLKLFGCCLCLIITANSLKCSSFFSIDWLFIWTMLMLGHQIKVFVIEVYGCFALPKHVSSTYQYRRATASPSMTACC